MTYRPNQWATAQSPQANAPITIRPIQPGDVDLIAEMHQRLSPESLYYRYLQPRIPSLGEIEQVCRLAPGSGAAFVATVQQPKESIISLAYYVREAQTAEPTAEPGILVEDRFQGQGLGRRLWRQLHDHAWSNQIHQLRVFAAPGNLRLLRLLQGSGFGYGVKAHGEFNEYLVSLDRQPAQPVLAAGSPLRIGHFALGMQLAQRLVLYDGELYWIPARYRLLRVTAGRAYVTYAGQDFILAAGQELQLERIAGVALVSAIGCAEVVVELFDNPN
jgi:RimJ/RimL family protein N-acetyltransferase